MYCGEDIIATKSDWDLQMFAPSSSYADLWNNSTRIEHSICQDKDP